MPLDIFYEITGEIFSNSSEKNLLQSFVIFCFKYFCLVDLTAGIELESFSRQFDWNIFALVLTFRIFLQPSSTEVSIQLNQFLRMKVNVPTIPLCTVHAVQNLVLRMPLNNYFISRLCLIRQLQAISYILGALAGYCKIGSFSTKKLSFFLHGTLC